VDDEEKEEQQETAFLRNTAVLLGIPYVNVVEIFDYFLAEGLLDYDTLKEYYNELEEGLELDE